MPGCLLSEGGCCPFLPSIEFLVYTVYEMNVVKKAERDRGTSGVDYTMGTACREQCQPAISLLDFSHWVLMILGDKQQQ